MDRAAKAKRPVGVALRRVTSALPGGGEERSGQLQMAEAAAAAIAARRHLVVQAGTGTGKSLAYLVPAILSGRRVVVATATKALQDQLAERDLPWLRARLGVPFRFAVLKGRSNYLCRQRATEVQAGGNGEPAMPLGAPQRANGAKPSLLFEEVERLLSWSARSTTGDRAELSFEPSPRAWGLLSVSAVECPGRSRCPAGRECFAEAARDRAAEADVIVVNMHLYASHLASESRMLPEHDLVVVDEAHDLEDVATAGLGLEVSGTRFRVVARACRPVLGRQEAGSALAVEEAGERLDRVLPPVAGRRLPPGLGAEVAGTISMAGERVRALMEAVRQEGHGQGTLSLETRSGALADPARARALLMASALAEDLATVVQPNPDRVAWVEERPPAPPALRLAPVEVGPLLAERLWGEVTAVLTSATIPPGMAGRLGLPADGHEELDVGSPFPYATNSMLYCAAHLPDPRRPGAERAAHGELARLVRAAGGRTLALFTSWRAMEEAAGTVREQVPFRILVQGELPKPALLEAFRADEATCLFATLGFWQGVDLPGPTLSLVVIDRIPFPRPDDPLMSARRERVGAAAFRVVDLPRAAMLLAQGAGRLIRSSSDRGVVAVLDRRLAHAGYRWDLVRALPPMTRTRHFADVERFLAEVVGRPGPAEGAPAPTPDRPTACTRAGALNAR